jgi:hypothetical protein
MKVTIIVPSMNELEGLKTHLPQIKKEWYDQLIVLIGQPQKDNSEQWCIDNGYQIFYGTGLGLWKDYTKLFKSEMVRGDIIITLSPDGNSAISAIPQLIDKIKSGYDLVIASRYLNRNKSKDDTRTTAIGNKTSTWLVNCFSKYKYTDALVIYRAYKIGIIEELGLLNKTNWLQNQLINLSNLYSYEPSLSIRAGRMPLKISEIFSIEPKAYRERRQRTWVHSLMILAQILHEGLR